MKILFTLDEAGSDDLKELLGALDSDFKIKNLKSDIRSATDEIIEIISPEIYDQVIEIYDKDEQDEKGKEFLYRTKLAIAINAYRNFAPDNDLGHTNSGRVARTEEHQKVPFEWQIDRSNKSLERKYYKAVDALLLFLDLNIDAWKETQVYKDSHKLFVRTTKDFDSYFSIDRSRLLMIKLMPGIRLAETSDIKPRIGKVLFEEMKTNLRTDVKVDEELLEKIKEACVYKALAWGMGRLSAQLFPEGVLQYKGSDRLSTQGKGPTLKSEPEAAAQKFEYDASRALLDIENIIEEKNKEEVVLVDLPKITPYSDANNKFFTT